MKTAKRKDSQIVRSAEHLARIERELDSQIGENAKLARLAIFAVILGAVGVLGALLGLAAWLQR